MFARIVLLFVALIEALSAASVLTRPLWLYPIEFGGWVQIASSVLLGLGWVLWALRGRKGLWVVALGLLILWLQVGQSLTSLPLLSLPHLPFRLWWRPFLELLALLLIGTGAVAVELRKSRAGAVEALQRKDRLLAGAGSILLLFCMFARPAAVWRRATTDVSRRGPEMILLPASAHVRYSRIAGVESLSYEVPARFPAISEIRGFERSLEARGWRKSTSNGLEGRWGSGLGANPSRGRTVAWMADWVNASGDELSCALEYHYQFPVGTGSSSLNRLAIRVGKWSAASVAARNRRNEKLFGKEAGGSVNPTTAPRPERRHAHFVSGEMFVLWGEAGLGLLECTPVGEHDGRVRWCFRKPTGEVVRGEDVGHDYFQVGSYGVEWERAGEPDPELETRDEISYDWPSVHAMALPSSYYDHLDLAEMWKIQNGNVVP